MKVKLLVDTAYNGPKRKGSVLDIPEDVANRWVKNRIAEIIEEPQKSPEVIEEDAVEEAVDYSKMNAKELYLVCREKGLEVEAKKSKEYYLEKLA